MRRWLMVLVLGLGCLASSGGDRADVRLLRAMRARYAALAQPVYQVHRAGPLASAVGRPAGWAAANAVRPQGWQLTGYSILRIDRENRLFRAKFGIINAEVEAGLYDQGRWDEFSRWQDRIHQREAGPVFGVCLTWEF